MRTERKLKEITFLSYMFYPISNVSDFTFFIALTMFWFSDLVDLSMQLLNMLLNLLMLGAGHWELGTTGWTHREAVAADVLVVQRHGHSHPDVGPSLHCRGRDGEVIWVVTCQKHLEHAVHSLREEREREKREWRKVSVAEYMTWGWIVWCIKPW